ncbi:MAG TPA: hypothetical protein PJ997_02080 [Candidatus Paceibacterota bacterium]|nr:hypothetical protein [Candidatus Paceibacterota bacterium]HMP19104.1 hypothetical protein [Candidatus Paceibacterota bacterium]HMP85108.1 hypothetical protein [Candidatus Paceibacterota bacterium]
MLILNKKVGETPLQLIERIRLENSELKNQKMSYAGRLDPMAEGQTLILIGEEENKNRQKYMNFDKEYVATFLIGFYTDTGDILGLIKKDSIQKKFFSIQTEEDLRQNFLDLKEKIKKNEENFLKITEQKYPWFSGKTVSGIKLFDHFKMGNFDIERPSQKIKINSFELLKLEINKTDDIYEYIKNSINSVSGDFRQAEILENWNWFFKNISNQIFTFEIKTQVTSGTFIRGLTENFDFPTTLLKLNRTKIFIK